MTISASSIATSTSILSHCPGCGYNLTGLPVDYQCPECAFAFDSRTRIWRARRFCENGGPLAAVTIVLLLSWIARFLLAPNLQTRVPGRPWMSQDIFVMIIIMIGAAWTLSRIVAFRAGVFVATTPRGLAYRLGKDGIIPWDQFREIRVKPAGRHHRIVIAADSEQSLDLSPVLRDEIDLRSFSLSVNEHRVRRRATRLRSSVRPHRRNRHHR